MTRVGLMAACALGLLGCAIGPPPPEDSLDPPAPMRQSLGSAFAQCTIDHGYDPAAAGGLTGLGTGEAAWRDCAHAALERVLQPHLREPHALDELIAEDRRLTAAIADGTATRDERAGIVAARLDVMQSHERVIRETEQAELSAGELLQMLDGDGDDEGSRVQEDLALAARALR